MSQLCKRFPESVRIDGVIYPLNTDFKVGLKIMEAYEDPRLVMVEKQIVMCGLLYKTMPEDFSKAVRAAVKFLDGGDAPKEVKGGRTYSFVKDAAYIYSAMLQTHRVDLQTAEMHWWKFKALFMDLGEETTFQRMVGLRYRRERGMLTKEEKRVWVEMEDILTLDEADPEREAAERAFERQMRG